GPKMTDDSEYRRKRDFERTPEPPATEVSGDVDPLTAPPGETFVIQQHYATRLHHDVRLEMFNGPAPVLVSWAVPKGLPRARGERHLAIRTEDHPMEYATFSGTIPAGEYGGGEVRIVDSGTYEMVGRTEDRSTFACTGIGSRGHITSSTPVSPTERTSGSPCCRRTSGHPGRIRPRWSRCSPPSPTGLSTTRPGGSSPSGMGCAPWPCATRPPGSSPGTERTSPPATRSSPASTTGWWHWTRSSTAR